MLQLSMTKKAGFFQEILEGKGWSEWWLNWKADAMPWSWRGLVAFQVWCDGQMTLSHHACVCKTTRLPRLNAAARTGQSFAMFRQPKTQVEIMLAFNSAAVACKKSLDWQALKGWEDLVWESYFPGKVEHIRTIRTFQNMLAQEKGQDRMPENVTHQSLNQVESFATASNGSNGKSEEFLPGLPGVPGRLRDACRQGAFSVLFQMEHEAVLPDLVLYNTILSCGKSNRWRWNTLDTHWTHSGHIVDTCKDVQRMHSWKVEKSWKVVTRIRGVERESVISSQRTLQADCSFVTADWQLCVAAKHGGLLAMCLRKASGGTKNLSAALEEKGWNKYKEDILCGLVAPTGLLISAAF